MMTQGTQAASISTPVDIPISGEMKRAQLGEGEGREMTNVERFEHDLFVALDLVARQLDRHQMRSWIECDVSQVRRNAKEVNFFRLRVRRPQTEIQGPQRGKPPSDRGKAV